jgi:hypothetical protein
MSCASASSAKGHSSRHGIHKPFAIDSVYKLISDHLDRIVSQLPAGAAADAEQSSGTGLQAWVKALIGWACALCYGETGFAWLAEPKLTLRR